MQVLDWRLPMGAGYQEYADAIFCAATDALLAPPMQAPQILSPWLPPVDNTVPSTGLPVWQGALAQRLALQTSATDAALAAVSNAETPSSTMLKAALAATLAFEDAHSETGQTACVERVTAADEAAREAAGAAEAMGEAMGEAKGAAGGPTEAARKALSAEIDQALDALGLARGADSRLCEAYEAGAPIAGFATPVAIADEMAYMRWLHECTDYEAQLRLRVDDLRNAAGRFYHDIKNEACDEVRSRYVSRRPATWPWQTTAAAPPPPLPPSPPDASRGLSPSYICGNPIATASSNAACGRCSTDGCAPCHKSAADAAIEG